MNARETTHTEDGVATESAPDEKRATRRKREPLLPEAGAAGAPLTAVIAIISFLAVLAMAAFLIINNAAEEWTASLRSEITIQIKGATAADIDAGAAAAMRILGGTDGVVEATLRDKAETEALLDPWLGRGNASNFLNIPAIIEVKVTPQLRDDLDLLRNQIAAAAPGAVIDDHSTWHGRLAAAARSGQALAFTIFLLVLSAACAISTFAARAGLAANHQIVSLLHLIGATDDFIAQEVQRRFFMLGLRGAVTGMAAALLALALAGVVTRTDVGVDSFLPQFTIGGWMMLWLASVPVMTCFVTALTARLTVLRALREQY